MSIIRSSTALPACGRDHHPFVHGTRNSPPAAMIIIRSSTALPACGCEHHPVYSTPGLPADYIPLLSYLVVLNDEPWQMLPSQTSIPNLCHVFGYLRIFSPGITREKNGNRKNSGLSNKRAVPVPEPCISSHISLLALCAVIYHTAPTFTNMYGD